MIYRPSLEGSFSSTSSDNREIYLNYVNPLVLNNSILSTAKDYLISKKSTFSIETNSLHDKHIEAILKDYRAKAVGVARNWFEIESEQLLDCLVTYLLSLKSSQSIRIRLDTASFLKELDLDLLLKDLATKVFRAGGSVLNGYKFNYDLTEDGYIVIKRLSVNGFLPENIYPQEDGFTLCLDSEGDLARQKENLYNAVSSLVVGKTLFISFNSNISKADRTQFIEEVRVNLFYKGYSWPNGFNYYTKWQTPDCYRITRFTMDGRPQAAIEP